MRILHYNCFVVLLFSLYVPQTREIFFQKHLTQFLNKKERISVKYFLLLTLGICLVTFCYNRFCISWDLEAQLSRHISGGCCGNRLVSIGISTLDHFVNHLGHMQST